MRRRPRPQLLPAFVEDALDPGDPVFFVSRGGDGGTRRKTQGERPFAEIKQAMRFRRCQLRGRANVWGEWNLVAAACNLRRLFALAPA